jgi:hypothetical protein
MMPKFQTPGAPRAMKKLFSSLKGHFGTVSCPDFPHPLAHFLALNLLKMAQNGHLT